MTSLQLNGEWTDKSGKIWRSSQVGNTFNWVQDLTGRVASGIVVPLNGGVQWIVFATFDGTLHSKFTCNNGVQLISSNETFTKAPNNQFPMDFNQSVIRNIPQLNGIMFQDYSGMLWTCTSHEGGHFILTNLTDGRTNNSYIVFDTFRNMFIVYMVFQRNGYEYVLKSETSNLNEIDLSNGDYFRRVGGNIPLPQPVDPPLPPNSFGPTPIQPPQVQQPPQPTTKYYRIGGGRDGISTWTKWNSNPCNTVIEGWEMMFEVDQNGNVSGSNKNAGQTYAKKYSGTFKNNVFDVLVKCDDGRILSYKGNLTGNKVRLDYVILAPGSQTGLIGDGGFNIGTLFETSAPPCQPKNYQINGKTYWKTYLGGPSNSIVDGWLMNFSVDKYGNVSGTNKIAGQTYSKSYSGTLLNNIMEVTVRWEDGRTASYKGVITNNTIKIDFVIVKTGTQPGADGDNGFNTGIITTLP